MSIEIAEYYFLFYGNSIDCPVIYEIFAEKLCITLTLTFRMGQGQM